MINNVSAELLLSQKQRAELYAQSAVEVFQSDKIVMTKQQFYLMVKLFYINIDSNAEQRIAYANSIK